MERVRVKMLAFNGAPSFVYENGRKRIFEFLEPDQIEFVDEFPEVLFFFTGGTEQKAMELVDDAGFYVLLASSKDNTYTTAQGVSDLMNSEGIASILLDLDNQGSADSLKEIVGMNE